MTDNLKRILVKAAMDNPRAANEIRDLAFSKGVTEREWEDIALALAMNPSLRQDPETARLATVDHPDNPDSSLYMTVRSSIPPGLKAGDMVYESPNGELFWIVWAEAAKGSPTVPAGFRTKGIWDGSHVVQPAALRAS